MIPEQSITSQVNVLQSNSQADLTTNNPAILQLSYKPQWVNRSVDKKPRQPDSSLASPTNPTTWNTYKAVIEAFERSQMNGKRLVGIGYVFNGEEVGIDLDHCVREVDGELVVDSWAKEVIEEVNSYTEYSPSRTGIHIIADGKFPGLSKDGGNRYVRDVLGESIPCDAKIEIYGKGRYFTVTGDHVPNTRSTISKRQDAINSLVKKFLRSETTDKQISTTREGTELSDDDVFKKIRRDGEKFSDLLDGEWQEWYGSQSEADQALCGKLWFYTGDVDRVEELFSKTGLMRDKWERDDYRNNTIENVIDGEVYTPEKKKQEDTTKQTGKGSNRSVLRFATPNEIMGTSPVDQLIEGVIEMDTVGVDVGESQSLKTFIKLDQSLCVASGKPWLGRKTKQGHVIYVFSEGRARLWKRLEAWSQYNKTEISWEYIHFIVQSVSLLGMENDITKLADSLPEKPVMILFDTLSKCANGVNENDATAMGEVIAVVDRLKAKYGCHVSLIHHTPKTGQGFRGSGVIENNTDVLTAYKRENKKEGPVTISCERTKDIEPFRDITVVAKIVWLGKFDNMGKEISSCVIVNAMIKRALPNFWGTVPILARNKG